MSVTNEVRDGVAIITLDDGKANAVSMDLISVVHRALDVAETDAKAIVLAGRPGRFSAGFDLKVMQGATPDEVRSLVTEGGKLALRLFESKTPVVAACTGHAIAMGAILLMACDTRIGSAGDFKIGLNETAIGMGLPEFGFILPKARLNPAWFTRAVVQGALLSPDDAVSAGFLDEISAPDQLMDRAFEIASALAQLPASAYAFNKAGMRRETIAALHDSFA